MKARIAVALAALAGTVVGLLLGTRVERRLYRFLGLDPSMWFRVLSAACVAYIFARWVSRRTRSDVSQRSSIPPPMTPSTALDEDEGGGKETEPDPEEKQ